MNKDLKDRLDKLEKELKESKDEIHSLKSSVSLKIERLIGKLFSRFTKKQIILGSLIVLFSISIIGIAGTVTKTYTFSSGDVVSASKINTNFDTLYTLVNGNLDDNNISGISASKITDSISPENLISMDNDSIIFYSTRESYNGNLGGRSGADQKCGNYIDRQITRYLSSCQNVRAVISISGSDQVSNMKSNYSIPDNFTLRGPKGFNFADSWDNFTDSDLPFSPNIQIGTGSDGSSRYYWYATNTSGESSGTNCSNWTSSSSGDTGMQGRDISGSISNRGNYGSAISCDNKKPLICICW